MSKLLEEALTKLAELPESEQDSIATWLLDELESDGRWKSILFDSGDALGRLTDEALADHAAGRTEELDPEKL